MQNNQEKIGSNNVLEKAEDRHNSYQYVEMTPVTSIGGTSQDVQEIQTAGDQKKDCKPWHSLAVGMGIGEFICPKCFSVSLGFCYLAIYSIGRCYKSISIL